MCSTKSAERVPGTRVTLAIRGYIGSHTMICWGDRRVLGPLGCSSQKGINSYIERVTVLLAKYWCARSLSSRSCIWAVIEHHPTFSVQNERNCKWQQDQDISVGRRCNKR